MRRLLAPLVAPATLRAGVYLVVGGVLAGAYLTLVAGFVQMADAAVPTGVLVALVGVTSIVVVAPFFLDPVRALQVHAVRTLLDVGADVVPDLPAPRVRIPAATRWRGAAWFGLHLVAGALLTLAILLVVPLVTAFVLGTTGTGERPLATVVEADLPPVAAVLLSVVGLLGLPYLAAALRVVLRRAAGPLLGPDQGARIAELEVRAARLAERNRIARDLHDSVGHALTVTTIQAAAAARLVDTDPDAARRALAVVEETGRTAMADLDHVVGLLRAEDADRAGTAPLRTLVDLPALLDEARATGVDLRADVSSSVSDDVPRATSSEAYRIVQEALTNALRHAPGSDVEVRVARVAAGLEIDVTSAVVRHAGAGPERRGGRAGRGLAGMADRVRLLGGEITCGPDAASGRWAVRVRLPLPTPGSPSGSVSSPGSGARAGRG
jgi:signal transduction histidine kinase